MNQHSRKKISMQFISAMLLFTGIFFTIGAIPNKAEAAAPALLQMGSHSSDVWDLQYRLNQQDNKVVIDGKFGPQTRSAVLSFQHKYGLMQDGIVGPITWQGLYKNTYSKADVNLLTHLVYSEARGESYKGQVAVAAVVLNRVQSDKFPNTVSEVIFQPGAFTAVDDGQFKLEPNNTARKAVLDAIRGWDPSNHALYYFNPKTATSEWIWSRPQLVTVGNHIFAA